LKKWGDDMHRNKENFQVVESTDAPVTLTRVTPNRRIQIVFWGLRAYIVVMVVLVIIGFTRGMH
jgi:hypothetical protein